MFPKDDGHYRECLIEGVSGKNGKFTVTVDDGWSLWCGDNCPIEPRVGMTMRQYGKGFGYAVRGLFIDGVKIWYRTESEETEHREIESYGADAADWLARWDAGKGVWSIEMGGLGPGYEQCIQIVTAEVVRYLLSAKVDCEKQFSEGGWPALSKAIDEALFANPQIDALGLSGAQVGAGKSLATKLYRDGPRGVMSVEEIKDRHIQVSKNFPQIAA